MEFKTQYAALPFIDLEGSIEILLITSRKSEKWILPKGWPEEGLAPHEVASKEAYEEAGLVGSINSKAIGYYHYLKHTDAERHTPCKVGVFPLRVKHHIIHWPEKGERKHSWVMPELAAQMVEEEELATLLRTFDPQI